MQGDVLLKSGEVVKVNLDNLKNFLKTHRDQIVVKKIPNMGKRRKTT